MASASDMSKSSHGGASHKHPKPHSHVTDNNGYSSDEDERALIRKWENYRRRLVKMQNKMIITNAKVDVLQSRVEFLEEKLLQIDFPEKVERSSSNPNLTKIVIGNRED